MDPKVDDMTFQTIGGWSGYLCCSEKLPLSKRKEKMSQLQN
jgi:hypothetical protein